MPIEPIKIFQDNGSGNVLANIFQGGQGVLTNILNNAVQIGRDISNKQLAQEQDLLGMRRQEQALAQRRGENLQQDWEDVFRFGENVRQFDTKFNRGVVENDRNYDANRSDAAWNQQRTAEQDILRADQWNKSYEVSKERTGLERDRLSYAQNKDTSERQNLLNFARGDAGAAPTTSVKIGDPLTMTTTDQPSEFGTPTLMPSEDLLTPTKQVPRAESLEEKAARAAILANQEAAALKAGDPTLAGQRAGESAAAAVGLYQGKAEAAQDRRLDYAEKKPETDANKRAENAAKLKELDVFVKGDMTAFPRHAVIIGKKLAEEESKDEPNEKYIAQLKAELVQSKERDSNVTEAEMAAVRSAPDEEAYVKMHSTGVIPEAVKKVRREFYRKVMGLGKEAPDTTASGSVWDTVP